MTIPPLFTIGHSTRTIPAFVGLLRAGLVEIVVDVRSIPRSRANPQYNQDVLPGELDRYGVGYRRIAELGGLRTRSRDIPAETNAFWQNRSFHNYADYALSDGFETGMRELLALAAVKRSAIMCSEAVWWRCHRRIIADYALLAGRRVLNLMDSDRADPATMTPPAIEANGRLVYPAPAGDKDR